MRATETTFFLQVEADTYRSWSNGTQVRMLHAKRITQKRPRKPLAGTVTVEVTLSLPDMLFVPQLTIEAEAIR